MNMGNETAIAYLDQDGFGSRSLLGAVYGCLVQSEPTILKQDRNTAVANTVPHLDEDFATVFDEFA